MASNKHRSSCLGDLISQGMLIFRSPEVPLPHSHLPKRWSVQSHHSEAFIQTHTLDGTRDEARNRNKMSWVLTVQRQRSKLRLVPAVSISHWGCRAYSLWEIRVGQGTREQRELVGQSRVSFPRGGTELQSSLRFHFKCKLSGSHGYLPTKVYALRTFDATWHQLKH